MRANPLKDQGGFTLPEVLVAMVMMATVLFALYAIFDASVRIFGAGRDRVEAVQNARLGLARMERELRAAYPPDRANGNTALLASFGEDHVTFYNDLNGNRTTLRPTTGGPESKEKISYALDAEGSPLRNGVPLVRSANDGDEDGRSMTFEYLDANGLPVTSGDETDVALVRIELEISVDRVADDGPANRTLKTSVALRNRR